MEDHLKTLQTHLYVPTGIPFRYQMLLLHRKGDYKSNLEASGVTLGEAHIKTPGSVGTVEKYHTRLREA